MLGAHEKDQVNEWLTFLQKCKKFIEWFLSVKQIIHGQKETRTNETLSDQLLFKLQ